MNRRGFLGSILALGAAPAIAKAASLMPVKALESGLFVPNTEIPLRFYSSELALSIDEFSRLYLAPAMQTLVSGIEQDLYGKESPGQMIQIRLPNSYVRRVN